MAMMPTLALDESGAITNERAELFALHVADGVMVFDAWRAAGPNNENTSTSLKTRKFFQAHPLWQARVERLKAERAALGEDRQWGQATWMVNEVFRMGRAQRDLGAMREAAKMRLQIAMKTWIPPEPEPPEAKPEEPAAEAPKEPEKPANVGAPLVQSPQSVSKQSEIRRKLLDKGLKTQPIPVEEDA